MASKASWVILLAVSLLLLSTTTGAINITGALGRYRQFSTMNDLFMKTGLTAPINKRNTITILAVENKAMSSISGRPEEEIKNILMNHVVLDYYDEAKLKGLKGNSTMLTTLYQTTGRGQQQNGFLKVSKTSDGALAFGSGVKGAPLNALYVKTVFHNPYSLSVVHVSMPIVAPGLGDPIQTPPPPAFPSSPFPPPEAASPIEAPAAAPEGEVVNEAPAPAPGLEPAASPVDDSAPAPAPTKRKKKIPAAADVAEPPSSGASITSLSFSAVAGVGLVAGLIAQDLWISKDV